MSKKVIAAVLLSGMFLSLIILLLTVAYAVKKQRISAENAADQLSVQQNTVSAETMLPTETVINYCIKEYDGELAVFRGDSAEPYKRYSVNLNLMTDEDRALLREGITVDSEKKLKRVIEDFTS